MTSRRRFALRTLPAAGLLVAAAPALATDLDLRRVLLSTGGVGYFEHEAQVEGDATLSLTVRLDQVDDVLKSVVVYDDKGGVGTVSLPGREPLEASFRDLPFGPDDLASPVALLTALKGERVRVAGPRALDGRLLSVTPETVALPDGRGTLERHRVAILTEAGVRQVLLEEVEALSFAEPAVQAQVDGALAALARQGDRSRRTLAIRTTGSGSRTVRVGYVVAAPLWKATYRLTLPPVGGASGDLQGWAVLENLSGQAWTAVDLTVVSGNPVTFRQDLYAPYFVTRPKVPVEVQGRVLPPADEGAVPAAAFAKGSLAEDFAAPPPPAPAMAAPQAMAARQAAAPRAAEPQAAESTEAATQVLFHYPQPVTLADGGSLLMPIVARAVPAEPVALYQPGTQPRHPLAAVRLVNDGGSGLPPGVLTLYERDADGAVGYVGDARLASLPAGEKRLLSFAVDRKVTVDREEQGERTLSRATVADGMLQLTITERQRTTYTVAGAAREPRSLIVEHPRRAGWTLIEPAADRAEVTEGSWRLPLTVKAGETARLAVTLERPRVDRLALTGLDPAQVQAYAASAELPKPVRDAMVKLAALRAEQSERERRVERVEAERTGLVAEQARLRENLASLPRDSDLFRRTLDKMGEAETRLEGQAKDAAAARKAAEDARQAVAEYVRGLKL